MKSYRIIPDKQLDNKNLQEMFRALHNFKSFWERRRFLYDYALVDLKPNQIGWEIKVTKNDARFYFTTSNEDDINLIHKSLAKSTIKEDLLDLNELVDNPDRFVITEMELKYHYFLSLNTSIKEFEPIASFLDIQKILRDDDYAIVQYIFNPESYDWSSSCTEAYEKFKSGEMPTQMKFDKKEFVASGLRALVNFTLGAGEMLQEMIVSDPGQVEKYRVSDSSVAKILKDNPLSRDTNNKPKHNAYITDIRLISRSKRVERREQIMRGLTVSFNAVRKDNYLVPKKMDTTKGYIEKIVNRESKFSFVKNILTTEEVAKLCLLPQVTLQNEYKMECIETREVDIPKELLKGHIPIGTGRKNGVNYPLYWEEERNIITLPKVVVGGMGAGKSEFTANYCVGVAKAGHGVIHFDYIKECEISHNIEKYVPKSKLIIIDLTNVQKPFSLAYTEVKITDNMSKWDKIKNASDLADQTAYLINALNDGMSQPLTSKMTKILNAACMVTYATGHTKVYDVINCLQNHIIRHEYIDDAVKKDIYKLSDIKISNLLSLDEINGKGKLTGTIDAKIEFIMDRVDILLRNPYLELMLMADPDESINFVDYMNQGKVVLIRMPERVFKKKWIRDVLSTYFMSRVWLATQIRGEQSKLLINHVVTDEIHQVPTTAKLVAETITEGRKFGVAYFFTCQYLKQFKVLLDGVKGAGVSYMLLAGTEKENFSLLKEESGEFTLEELMHLKRFTSFNIIQTSQGVKKFIADLPWLL